MMAIFTALFWVCSLFFQIRNAMFGYYMCLVDSFPTVWPQKGAARKNAGCTHELRLQCGIPRSRCLVQSSWVWYWGHREGLGPRYYIHQGPVGGLRGWMEDCHGLNVTVPTDVLEHLVPRWWCDSGLWNFRRRSPAEESQSLGTGWAWRFYNLVYFLSSLWFLVHRDVSKLMLLYHSQELLLPPRPPHHDWPYPCELRATVKPSPLCCLWSVILSQWKEKQLIQEWTFEGLAVSGVSKDWKLMASIGPSDVRLCEVSACCPVTSVSHSYPS